MIRTQNFSSLLKIVRKCFCDNFRLDHVGCVYITDWSVNYFNNLYLNNQKWCEHGFLWKYLYQCYKKKFASIIFEDIQFADWILFNLLSRL